MTLHLHYIYYILLSNRKLNVI